MGPAIRNPSGRPRLIQRFMGFVSARRILSDARMLELYPPFWMMRIKVLELPTDWRRVRIRFEFPSEVEVKIRRELATDGRSTPTFEYGYYLADGTRCTLIRNTVAIRPKGYAGPPHRRPRPAGSSDAHRILLNRFG